MLKWLGTHGAVLATIATASVAIWLSTTGLKTEVQLSNNVSVSTKTEVLAQMVANKELYNEKLSQIQEDVSETKRDMEILQSDVDGLSIAATDGAASRDRRLSGKITSLQQTMVDVRTGQEALVDTMNVVQEELTDIQKHLLAHPDTVVMTDTLVVEKDDKGFWRRLSPFH